MTKIERLESQLMKLRELRAQSVQRNDFMNMARCTQRIEEVEAELEEAKKYVPTRLSEVLTDKGEKAKNRIYKCLLKCALASDFLNDCAFEARSELAKMGIKDFHFRADLEQLCELSKKVAAMVIIPNQTVLTDMMTDDDKFVDSCHRAANKHLKEKLKL